MNPIRIQRKRSKGWKMPENTVYVGRASTYGNPFIPGLSAQLAAEAWFRDPTFRAGFRGNLGITRDAQWAVISFHAWLSGDDYRAYLPPQCFKESGTVLDRIMTQARTDLLLSLKQLRGKNLACWCPLDQPCHADVLLGLANK